MILPNSILLFQCLYEIIFRVNYITITECRCNSYQRMCLVVTLYYNEQYSFITLKISHIN